MREYVPTAKDITELNTTAEQVTDEELKSRTLPNVAKTTAFYKKLSKNDGPDCVDMSLKGISERGKILVNRIAKACDYSDKKPDDFD